MASADLTPYTNHPTNPSAPPPRPPPKPSIPTPQQQRPPAPQTSEPHRSNQPSPPTASAPWLPPILHDKSTATLSTALQNPPLLTALSSTHPSLHPSPLPHHLQQTQSLATELTTRYEHLVALRERTQGHLLRLHALERQWRERQAVMDRELAPWSAKVLYRRLREGEREGEEWCEGVEGSWLDGGAGEAGEREVGEFLRGYREGRVKVWKRREARERWDEGRVGGWR